MLFLILEPDLHHIDTKCLLLKEAQPNVVGSVQMAQVRPCYTSYRPNVRPSTVECTAYDLCQPRLDRYLICKATCGSSLPVLRLLETGTALSALSDSKLFRFVCLRHLYVLIMMSSISKISKPAFKVGLVNSELRLTDCLSIGCFCNVGRPCAGGGRRSNCPSDQEPTADLLE